MFKRKKTPTTTGDNMTKKNCLKWLYNDWLDYKKHYKKLGYPMNETFIEWLNREIELEGVICQ